MKTFQSILLVSMIILVTSCSGSTPDSEKDPLESDLNEIVPAKTLFALSKGETPVLNTHEWDQVFGGETGSELRYDRFGEIDELVFVAAPHTPFDLQRQIRKKTRAGVETIYYKATTSVYQGESPLWIDGRFLDLRDVRPESKKETIALSEIILRLRALQGMPYTWHGGSSEGISLLLDYYPPLGEISSRLRSDWMLKGFDTLGLLYRTTGGETPLDLQSLSRFGEGVFVDLQPPADTSATDDLLQKTKQLMAALKPLDIIFMSDRIWIMLDKEEVMTSRYRSKFDGTVEISRLIDTLYGLLQKAVLVKDPFQELEPTAQPFFIRRFADMGSLGQTPAEPDAPAKPEN